MENTNKKRPAKLQLRAKVVEGKGKRMLVEEPMETGEENGTMVNETNIGNVATGKSKQAVEEVTAPPEKTRKMQAGSDGSVATETETTAIKITSSKKGNNGQQKEQQIVRIEDGRPVLPELGPLQQCQQMQQIQGLIQFHEQQVKYRSYMQLDILRHLRKQLSDQMMLHPQRHHYEALVEAAKNNRLTPLSSAEKAALEYFTSMAEWTLEARALLQDKESPFYLLLFGRQVNDFKDRLNEITTHEQFLVFAPLFAERIDYHREMINTLNRRSSVSLA